MTLVQPSSVTLVRDASAAAGGGAGAPLAPLPPLPACLGQDGPAGEVVDALRHAHAHGQVHAHALAHTHVRVSAYPRARDRIFCLFESQPSTLIHDSSTLNR